MELRNGTWFVAVTASLVALSACGGSRMAPYGPVSNAGVLRQAQEDTGVPLDSTSILKKLKKDLTIGSTVDPGNGDTGSRAIAVVPSNFGKLKKGHILVCNFDNSKGQAGKGTTVEQLAPAPNSKPARFVQNAKIEGCDGVAIDAGEQVYASGMTTGFTIWFDQNGQMKKSYGKAGSMPLGNQEAPPIYLYSPWWIFIGDGNPGAMDNIALGPYGSNKLVQAINGFPVNKGSGWSKLGPSGFAYWCGALPGARRCGNKADTLFVVDGACNAVVSIDHASSLLVKDEITVGSDCKSFKCKHPATTCGKLVKAGSPLNKPYAAAILPNGNFVVANTGGNTLVELMPNGKVLATKAVGRSKTPGIWGLFAIGKNDSDTALYYTDKNSNELHELEQ